MNYLKENRKAEVNFYLLILACVLIISAFFVPKLKSEMQCANTSTMDRFNIVLKGLSENDQVDCTVNGKVTSNDFINFNASPIEGAPPPIGNTLPISFYDNHDINLDCNDSQTYYQFSIPINASPQSTGTQTLNLTNNQGWDLWIKISKIDVSNGLQITRFQNMYQSFPNGSKSSFKVEWLWNVPYGYSEAHGAATVYFQAVCDKPSESEMYNPIPSAPSTLDITDKTDHSLSFKWASSEYATGYKLYDNNGSLRYVGSDTVFTDDNLLSGTYYTYYVYAYNDKGTSSNRAGNSAWTLGNTPKPKKPSNFKTTDITDNTISLSWDAVSDATSYFISNYSVCSGNKTTCKITGLLPGTTYSFYLYATNQYGNSDYAYLSVKTTGVNPLPGQTTNLWVTGTTDTTVSLAWNSIPNVTGYHLWNYVNANVPSTQTTYTATGFIPGTRYYICMAGVNQYGQGPASCVEAFTTGTNPLPKAPTHFITSHITNTSMDVSWDAVDGATSYKLYKSGSLIYSGTNTSFSLTNLTKDTYYSYTVYAINNAGSSPSASTGGRTTNISYDGSSDIGSQCATTPFTQSFTIPSDAVLGDSGEFRLTITNNSSQDIFANIINITHSGSLFEGDKPIELVFDTDQHVVGKNSNTVIPVTWVYPFDSTSLNQKNSPSSITINGTTTCN